MADSYLRPEWTKTNVPMDLRKRIWERMASGDSIKQIEIELDQKNHLDRATIKRVGQELLELPAEIAVELPDKVQGYRRELRKRKGFSLDLPNSNQPQSKGLTDSEMRIHVDELLAYGKELSGSFRIEIPDQEVRLLAESLVSEKREHANSNSYVSLIYGDLFPWFRQHLSGCECWAFLDETEKAMYDYRQACKKAYDSIRARLIAGINTMSETDINSMSESLLVDGYHRIRGSVGLGFSYSPREQKENGMTFYCLQLGNWWVGRTSKPDELGPLASLHKNLAADSISTPEMEKLSSVADVFYKSSGNFVDCLSPDARLRKLILSGRCELCP